MYQGVTGPSPENPDDGRAQTRGITLAVGSVIAPQGVLRIYGPDLDAAIVRFSAHGGHGNLASGLASVLASLIINHLLHLKN